MLDEGHSGNSVVGDDTVKGYATGSYAIDCDSDGE